MLNSKTIFTKNVNLLFCHIINLGKPLQRLFMNNKLINEQKNPLFLEI